MFASFKRWMLRGTLTAGLALIGMAALPSQAQAQGYSSNFSYYNPRSGMQYSQGYSMQGRNFSNYFSYGLPPAYRYGGYGYRNNGGGYGGGYTNRNYGYANRSHCR